MTKFLNWIGYEKNLDRKNRFAYITTGFGVFFALLFLVSYIVLVKNFWVILGTSFCLIDQLFSIFLLKRRLFTLGKYLMLLGFLLQECAVVFLWFPSDVSFNYFLFIVTPVTFFIFDFQIPKEKKALIFFNIVTVLLLFAGEVLPGTSPLIPLTPLSIRFFSGVSVFCSASSIAIVFYYYGYVLNQTSRDLNLLAETDSLTQVYNRRTLYSEGKALVDICKKTRSSFSFILFDIDLFKEVNDKFGQPEGDLVLVQFCQLIQKNIRQNDLFARYNGEKFALIVKDTGANGIGFVAEALRKLVEKTLFILSDEKEISLCISLGVVSFSEQYSSFEEIVSAADQSLYKAKQSGRNQVVFLESQ